jgi:hypothetical protein
MRHSLLALPLLIGTALFGAAVPAHADLNIGINIGVDMNRFPNLVLVPGYPVYYDPDAEANYFFYDGSYWVLDDDQWYASSWYDGPWEPVDDFDVPLFLLRVPVAYYRVPPSYFEGWRRDAPPRWGEYWGPQWQERHPHWDRWHRRDMPQPAPLPTYQRNFSGARYPHAPEQQRVIRDQHYHYAPHEAISRQVLTSTKVPPNRGSSPERDNPQPMRDHFDQPRAEQDRAPPQMSDQARGPYNRPERRAPAMQAPDVRSSPGPREHGPERRESTAMPAQNATPTHPVPGFERHAHPEAAPHPRPQPPAHEQGGHGKPEGEGAHHDNAHGNDHDNGPGGGHDR